MREHVEALERLAGDAPTVSPSISRIARWSHNTKCGVAAAALAARVDLDKLLECTNFEPVVGESPFMRERGQLFERRVRQNDYEDLVPILRAKLRFEARSLSSLNLKKGYPPNREGLRRRATKTREWVDQVLSGDKEAPHLIEGAVLPVDLDGHRAYFEADAIGLRSGPIVHGIEMKSWPFVDGRVDDPSKASEALRQLGFYLHLLRQVVHGLGGDPTIVSDTGLLVTPLNVGLRPVGSTRDLAREISLADKMLARLPRGAEYAELVRAGLSFGPVAEPGGTEAVRLSHLAELAERAGTHYQTSCLGSCGLAKFCREKLHLRGDPTVCGSEVVRSLPGVRSLARAAALANGAEPTALELSTGAAELVSRAGSLYSERLAQIERAR